ncbi:MAG: hypothetical protein ABIT83_11365 [Massilia sp.]
MHHKSCYCANCQSGAKGSSASLFEVLPFPSMASISKAEETELAMELLSVSSEEELDQFLGKMFKSAWRGIKKVGSAVGKIAAPLGGALKGLAKVAMPFVGGALGSFIPIPGVCTALGTALGGALSKAMELEFEGMDGEQQEFEMARRFVRIASSAAQQAAQAAPGRDPHEVVRQALADAMRSHLPAMPEPVTGRWRQRRAAWAQGQQ